MADTYLDTPYFKDDAAARTYLESLRWPNGPVCPHCGVEGEATQMQGKSHRPGLYSCRACREPFTVTVGTVYERSKIALHKWLLATYLLTCSKKGMSSLQLSRMIGVTYKTAWFMTHRIREAMRDTSPNPIGGEGKVVETDETYVGGKEHNRHYNKRKAVRGGHGGMAPVLSLVERHGNVRSFHVANVTAKTLRPIMVAHINKASFVMTDEAPVYRKIGKEFKEHIHVNHRIKQYAHDGGRGRTGERAHTNTAESFFAIVKRGVYGVYHSVSEQHLHRYLSEFDFRYNARFVTDHERMAAALKGADGKRLTYRQPN